jgi:threonine aldolase
MFCLSKGLAAPVGSMLVGDAELIAEARRVRKLFGGGMRQVGVLAAPGIVALTEMVDRLPEDHARARSLAEGLAALPAVDLDPATVRTNIIVMRLREERFPARDGLTPAARLMAGLKERGVLVGGFSATEVRLVTLYEIGDTDVERALTAARDVLAS